MERIKLVVKLLDGTCRIMHVVIEPNYVPLIVQHDGYNILAKFSGKTPNGTLVYTQVVQ